MGQVAVVLVNLGTPVEPTAKAVRRFLREFLSDQRVIDYPPVLWRTLLELVILPIRSPKTAAKYASVWLDGGSALAVYSARQVEGVQARLGDAAHVELATTYGEPSVANTLSRLYRDGFKRVLVIPMYSQYSITTVASVLDEVARYTLKAVGSPELRWVTSFEADEGYIDAMAARIEASWKQTGRPDFAAGDKLLLSFHGIPQAYDKAGDPYRSQCFASAALLREKLGVGDDECLLTFQSKFGPAVWLTPATIDTVARLGAAGVKRVDVFCPGFLADCLETLEEINMLNREAYAEAYRAQAQPGAGEGEFNHIPCLNDDPKWLDALTAIVRANLAGWV
ncbi:MAG: ferrochelatase [Propionibacteriaceae bacterium]|jgi:ferrochelatase|nr:ferrochelatase [Propionibacteriaceae bacterium]